MNPKCDKDINGYEQIKFNIIYVLNDITGLSYIRDKCWWFFDNLFINNLLLIFLLFKRVKKADKLLAKLARV